MVNKIRYATLILVVGLLIAGCKTASSGKEKPDYKAENDKNGISSYSRFWEFPPPPKPHDFGNLLLDRRSAGSDVGPVIFSHWTHRIKYSCRICHFELEFSFKRNATEFTEQDNRNGLFCGACHNGKEAFGHTEENCAKCHDQDPSYYEKNFGSVLGRLPRAKHGNLVDWVGAIRKTNPRYSIYGDKSFRNFRKVVVLESEWGPLVPPAYFPHAVHVRLLDCSNCHPGIFNIEKKTTKHFRMDYILQGQFCGACHLNVAFPMNDCARCHPKIES